jgi:Na+/H+ antiporter NhaD/arsenite permease-like protein
MQLTALVIFVVTYIGIIFTRLPKINIDRPSAAFFGAVAMVVFGVLDLREAVEAIDYNTIVLLLGMMIIISTLQLDGFFSLIAEKTLSWSRTPFRLLVIITFVTGFASAFLVNDAVVLLFTPVIITICRASRLNPVPYLMAEILSANIGSAMTITGNPQNMLIGMNSGIDYAVFFYKLIPISMLGMGMIVYVVRWFYRSHFKTGTVISVPVNTFEYRFASMKFSVPIFIAVVILFFIGKITGLSIPVIAILGAALILILGKVKPSEVIRNVDWVLLLFFATLFIVVEGAVKAGLMDAFIHSSVLTEDMDGIVKLHGLSLIMSQIVSNVPYTVIMLPVLKPIQGEILWLTLASASTLAGNATIIGAMANLIVIESAEKMDVNIRFFEFFKIGIVVTLLSFLISVGILMMWL